MSSPFKVGDVIRLRSATVRNDVGGTSFLPPGGYEARVGRVWHDRETGWHCEAALTTAAGLAASAAAGTTGFKPGDYAKYGEAHEAGVRAASEAFDPSTVYASESDLAGG